MSWNKLCDHGERSVRDILSTRSRYLTPRPAPVHSCGDNNSALLDPILDCEIVRDTDAGPTIFSEYMNGSSYISNHRTHAKTIYAVMFMVMRHLAVSILGGASLRSCTFNRVISWGSFSDSSSVQDEFKLSTDFNSALSQGDIKRYHNSLEDMFWIIMISYV